MLPHKTSLHFSVANLGILCQDLAIFLGYIGIFILRVRPWDFSWDFSKLREKKNEKLV